MRRNLQSSLFAILFLGIVVPATPLQVAWGGALFQAAQIPPSDEHPDGMLEIESEADAYAASYQPDIEYARYGDRVMKLNLLLPVDPGARGSDGGRSTSALRPLIVYVQGSAWMPQRLYTAIPQLADFAHRGYVVASVEYRPSQEALAPAQLQDVKAAIRFMRAHAEEYHIDPNKIGIWGDSSGGHMAALVGTSDGETVFVTEDHADQSNTVQAVVDFYGPTDFRQMDDYPSRMVHNDTDSPESRVVGGPIQDPAYAEGVAAYNPITYITPEKQLPPFLIMHGDVDRLVPFNQSVLLYEALRAAEQDVLFYKVKGGGHGVRFWTPGVLKIVHEFFDRHLK